jgi:putative spermidine/putrescine transport system substrate-binding protein
VPRPSRAARDITFAGYGDWFQAAFDPIVLAPFRKAHPDIPVFYYPIGNSFQALSMLRSGRLYPSADVVLLDAGVAARATREKLVEPLTPETMPAMKDLRPDAVMPDTAGPVMIWDSLALGYNPGLVAAPPHAWRDLWDSAYGRIAVQTPPDPAALALTQMASTLFGGQGDLQSLDIGITALTALVPRIVLWDPRPDIYAAVTYGDAAIGPCWNGRARNQAAKMPGRFAAVLPEEGSPVLATTVNLVKGTPQPDAARTLIAWLLGAEAQRLMAEAMFFAPANAGTGVPAAALALAGATPAMMSRRMAMDWAMMTAIRDQLAAEWRRRNLAGR